MLVDEEVMSDDDKNKIELVEGEMDMSYEPPPIKEFAIQNLTPETSKNEDESPDKEETMIESFVIPESEGFSLDFIQKNRTNDKIRRNFLSKLTY